MASILPLLPLAVAAVLAVLPVATRASDRLNDAASRLALGLFGRHAAQPSARRSRRRNVVLSAHMDVMYRVYAARTLLFAATYALVGSILGLYAIVLGIEILAVPVATMERILPGRLEFLAENLTLPTLSVLQVFVLFLLSSATFGAAVGIGTYLYRWSRPTRIADRRETRIEESLPRTVAFMFALSRSGMSHKALVETLARNSTYFGEAADEFIISLRDMEFSNTDFLSATQRLARTTPSTEFANFAEDLTDVLRTGRPMSEYFREEYEQYQQDKESRQERILEQLAALAEGYVALLVAGPLFLITILVIIGLLGGGTLDILRAFVYVLVPAASVGFMIYLGDLAAGLGIDTDIDEFNVDMSRIRRDSAGAETEADVDGGRGSAPVTPDGGAVVGDRTIIERLATYDRMRRVREQLARPVETALQSPNTVLYVATPVATAYVLVSWTTLYLNGGLTLRGADDFLIQACLFAMGTFAIAEYSSERRLRRIERALPDLIDRLADRTEAGMSFTRALRELDPSSVPGLEPEIRELRADLEWGGRTSEALARFAERTRSVFAVRAVILIVNAVHASGDVAPVLRIAADEAQTDRRLDRRRRQELLVYLIIIYVSFAVFVGIIVALVVVFVPALPSAEQLAGQVAGGGVPGGAGLGGLGGSSPQDRAGYELVMFHASVVQGAVAGFTAGKLSQGSVRAGAKHATVMVGIAYVAMLLLA